MGTLVITQHVTLDGAIEMLDDWFDPTDQDPQLLAETRRQTAREDALLLGRQTFVDLRGFWPAQTDDTTGITASLNRVRKYVVSSTLTDPEWENSEILTGDWRSRVAELTTTVEQDIVVTGSITLCHALIEADLVDEFRLFAHPAVQGRGRRLFPDGHRDSRLRPEESVRYDQGIVYTRYRVQR